MEVRSSALDSGSTTPYNTVFIDTSLDTHLAMTISDSETVSNLRKKISYEHPLLFPNIGGINIHAIKVKRKGYFYHLSDSMFVKSAFDGFSKSWFLSIDASSLEELSGNEHSRKPNSGDIVACFGMTNNPSTEENENKNDSGKRKRKKRSSNSVSQVVATAPSTEEDRGENSLDMAGVPKNLERDPDAAGVLGQGVQDSVAFEPCFISMKENSCVRVQEIGKNNEVTHSSDVDMGAVDAVNVKSKINSPEVAADSAVERVRVSEDLHTIAAEGKSPIVVQEANNLNKDTRFSRNDNVTFNVGQKFDSDEIARVAEERELSNNKDPKAMPSKCTTSNRDGIGMDSKVDVTSDLFNANANGASGTSSKRRKKSKKSRDPVASGTEHRTCSIIGISSTAPHEPAHKDHSSDKSGKDESILSPIVGEEVLETTVNTSSLATVMETENVIRNVLESLQDIRNNAVNVESGNEQFDSDQCARVAEKRELSNNKDPNAMPSKCTSSNRDEIGMNSKVDVTSDLFNANGNVASVKSSKKRKKSKKSRHPVASGTEHRTCSIIGISSTAAHEPAHKDHSSDKSGKDESILSPVVGEKVLETTVNTSSLATFRETNNVNQNVLESFQDIRKNTENVENGDEQFDSDQCARAAEERELSNNNDANAMPSKCNTSNKVDVTSHLFNANGNVASVKSSKKRKKSKKSRHPVASGTEHTTCSIIGISSTAAHEPVHKDHSSNKSRKDESILSPVVGEEVLETTVNTSRLATVRETNNVNQNMLESLQDIRKNTENVENGDEKSRRKTKRKRNSASKSLPAIQTEDDVNCKNSKPLVNNIMDVEVDASRKLTKKTKLVNPSSKNPLNGSNMEPANNATGVEANSEGVNEGRPLQDLHSDVPNCGSTVETTNHTEILCESDNTIVNDNFVPSQCKPDIVVPDEMLVDKVIITEGADNVVKIGKDKKRLDVHSNGISPDLQTSLKFSENEGNGGKVQAFNSINVDPQQSLSKDDGDNLKLQSQTKLPKVSGIEARAPPSHKSDEFNKKLEEATRANAVGATGMHARSKISKETVASSTSGLKSSKKFLPKSERGNGHQSHVDIRKVSNNNGNGEVVNGSKPKKSLLATWGAIFKDDSDGSCDEVGVDNSDNSTRTPSDNSLSSDYSDGGSAAQQNGSYSSEKKKHARRNITKSDSGVRLDTILRRSSRFQAAKLTASQSQLQDTESQPDEFVPDSLAKL